jgi:hypothetical protein
MRRPLGTYARILRAPWFSVAGLLAAGTLLLQVLLFHGAVRAEARSALHFASNGNFDPAGNYLPHAAGFNLADVNSPAQLDALPEGVKGLVWVGQCNGADAKFVETIRPFIGNEKLFGFYLMDDPDPTGQHFPLCKAENLKAESDWIHANVPGAKTFVLLMTMTSSRTPSFKDTYNPANSHVDLFGIDPYPCRTELNGCDYRQIDRYVAAAEAAGVPRDKMIPVYQTFGGGRWFTDGGGRYVLPSASQMQQMLARWDALVPAPVFDFAYSWGTQKGASTLAGSPELQAVFLRRNGKPTVLDRMN